MTLGSNPVVRRFAGISIGFAERRPGGLLLPLTLAACLCHCGGSGAPLGGRGGQARLKTTAHQPLGEGAVGEQPNSAPRRSAGGNTNLNTDGEVPVRLPSAEAREHAFAALQSKNAGDGARCLQQLDTYDKLEPRSASTDINTSFEYMLRATCLMLSGQCDAGKQLARRFFERKLEASAPPNTADEACDGLAIAYCRSNDLNPRELLLRALTEIKEGARTKPHPTFCQKAYETIVEQRDQVKPRHADDPLLDGLKWVATEAPGCFVQAKACDQARNIWSKEYASDGLEKLTPAELAQLHTATFNSHFSKQCPAK